ncbi:MAG: biotin/lipoyl-binding protein [Planctomycetota bacterium]
MAGSRSKTLTYGLPVVGAAAFAAGVALVAVNRPVTAQEQPPRPPTTAPAVSGDNPFQGGNVPDPAKFIGAVGVSEPAGEAIDVAAHVDGVIASVPVRAGDRVKRGDALLVVDTRSAERAVAEAEARVAVAEAEVRRLEASIPARRAAVTSAQAAVRSQEANVAAAEADADDKRNLLRVAEAVSDPRAIAAEEVAQRRFAVTQAEARVAVAEAGVEEAKAALAEAEVDLSLLAGDGEAGGAELVAARSQVDSARRALAKAETDLELRTVRSPLDAKVMQVNARPGAFASANTMETPLLVLGRDAPPQLRVEIDEVDIARFTPDADAWASPRGDASRRLELELDFVEPLVEPKRNLAGRTNERVDTRVLRVVYTFADPPGLIGVGQQFDVYVRANPGGGGR